MRRKSSFLTCPVPGIVQGDFSAPLRCARNDRKQESLSPHGLRRHKALLDLPLCHIVMLSNQLNQPLRGFPLPPLTRSPSPMDGGGKDVAGNAFCSCAMLSILLNQLPQAAFPPLVPCGTTFAPVGSVSHDSQVAITPLRIVFPCQPAKAVGQ